jgi:sigma-E factor negative regulatory protein RseC
MMEERVQVVAVDGGEALVRAAAGAGGCGSCAMQGGCATSALGRFLRRQSRTWKIPNTLAAAVGDEITVGVPDAALLKAALLAYLIPILSLLTCAALAAATGTGDFQVALGAGLGLVLGIVLARRQSGRFIARLTPRITARTSP